MHRDAVLVEREQDRLGLDAVDAEADEVGEAVGRVAVARRRRGRRASRGDRVGEPPRRAASSRAGRRRQLGRGGAEADDRGDVLDAAAPRPLLRAADDERRDAQTRAG